MERGEGEGTEDREKSGMLFGSCLSKGKRRHDSLLCLEKKHLLVVFNSGDKKKLDRITNQIDPRSVRIGPRPIRTKIERMFFFSRSGSDSFFFQKSD